MSACGAARRDYSMNAVAISAHSKARDSTANKIDDKHMIVGTKTRIARRSAAFLFSAAILCSIESDISVGIGPPVPHATGAALIWLPPGESVTGSSHDLGRDAVTAK